MKRSYQCSQNLNESEKKDVENELNLGYLNLQDGMFEQAKQNFQLALSIDRKCADAFWGLMLEKYKIKNEDDLLSYPTKYKEAINSKECLKACQSANDEQKEIYKNLLERIAKIEEGENY